MKKMFIIAALVMALCMTSMAALAEESSAPKQDAAAETVEAKERDDTDRDDDKDIDDDNKDIDDDTDDDDKDIDDDKDDYDDIDDKDDDDDKDIDGDNDEDEDEYDDDDEDDKDDADKSDDKADKKSIDKVNKSNGKSKIDKEWLARKKDELKAKKSEAAEYIKEIKELFKDADSEARKEILSEIEKLKRELKDYSIGTFIKGIEVDYDKYDGIKPRIEKGRTLVPVRALSETYGAEVSWDAETGTVAVTKDDTVIVMKIDSLSAKVNGEDVTLEIAPELTKGRTVVPLRFVLEALGLDVQWDAESRTIIVE